MLFFCNELMRTYPCFIRWGKTSSDPVLQFWKKIIFQNIYVEKKKYIDEFIWYILLINNNYYILYTNSILKSFNTNKRWSKFKFQYIVLFKSLKSHFLDWIFSLSLIYRLVIIWYKWVILYLPIEEERIILDY